MRSSKKIDITERLCHIFEIKAQMNNLMDTIKTYEQEKCLEDEKCIDTIKRAWDLQERFVTELTIIKILLANKTGENIDAIVENLIDNIKEIGLSKKMLDK